MSTMDQMVEDPEDQNHLQYPSFYVKYDVKSLGYKIQPYCDQTYKKPILKFKRNDRLYSQHNFYIRFQVLMESRTRQKYVSSIMLEQSQIQFYTNLYNYVLIEKQTYIISSISYAFIYKGFILDKKMSLSNNIYV